MQMHGRGDGHEMSPLKQQVAPYKLIQRVHISIRESLLITVHDMYIDWELGLFLSLFFWGGGGGVVGALAFNSQPISLVWSQIRFHGR